MELRQLENVIHGTLEMALDYKVRRHDRNGWVEVDIAGLRQIRLVFRVPR